MKPDISIIIPGFNEEDLAADTVRCVDAYLAEQPFSAEVIFVDDGSTDNTYDILVHTPMPHASKRVIRFSRNFGSHAAIRAGFLYARAEYCMMYYMDMSDDISIIGTFFDSLSSGYDIVGGRRIGYKMSLGSRIFSKLQRRYICADYPMEGLSLLAINGKVRRVLNENVTGNSSIFLQIYNMGFRKCIVDSPIHERAKGSSKWTFAKKLRLLIDTFVSFSHMPIRAVSTAGIIFSLLGLLYAVVLLIIKVFQIVPLEAGWPTLIAIVLIGFGITNISLGVISEYLVRVLDAARKPPVFIVDTVYEAETMEAHAL